MKSLKFERQHETHSFIGETIPVRLVARNEGWLPVIWLRIQDNLPLDLAPLGSYKRVLSLGVHSKIEFEYELMARKRGLYQIGPNTAVQGDIFGFGTESQLTGTTTSLVVYPRFYTMSKFTLPSRSPLGSLPAIDAVSYDPSRIRGKRDYQSGDNFRLIDWKTTASTGRLQVKQLETTINIESFILVNLNLTEYEFRKRIETAELAIVTAASIASWIIKHRQSVGMVTNGALPEESSISPSITARHGRRQLMRLLEVLAQIQPVETDPFVNLISEFRPKVAWGTTMLLITGAAGDEFFHEARFLQHAGVVPILIIVGNNPEMESIRRKAATFKIPFSHIRNELELETWEGWHSTNG